MAEDRHPRLRVVRGLVAYLLRGCLDIKEAVPDPHRSLCNICIDIYMKIRHTNVA